MPLLNTVVNQNTYQYIKTWEALEKAVQRLSQYVNEEENPRLALDVETYWIIPPPPVKVKKDGTEEIPVPKPFKQNGILQGTVRTIQIGLPPEVEDFQYIIDVKALVDGIEDMQKIGDLLRPILTKARIFGQNLSYEYQFMWVLFNIRLPSKNLRDVWYINAVTQAGNKAMRNNLGALYNNYLEPNFFKSYTGMYQAAYENFKKIMQKSDWKAEDLTEEQLIYAAHDVSKLIFVLYDSMVENHPTRSIDNFIDRFEQKNSTGQTILNSIKLEWQCIPIFAKMEVRGMKYNLQKHNTLIIPRFLREMDEAWEVLDQYIPKKVVTKGTGRGKARIVTTTEERININAWQQGIPAFEKLGIILPNYQQETLEELNETIDHPALEALMKFRAAKSLLSKYGEAVPKYTGSDGRVRATWRQLGGDQAIDTGRSSCVNPALLTTPDEELFRDPFEAEEEYELIDADYSQIEPRVMAFVCNDETLKEVYSGNSNVDRHSLTAQIMFDLPELPDEHSPYRKAGKEYNLGTTYGMGIAKAMHKIARATKGEVTFASVDDFKEKRDRIFAQLKGVKRFTDQINREVRAAAEKAGSLRPFLNDDKPIAVVSNHYGRARRWILSQMLSKAEMELVHTYPDFLDKDYGPREERWKNTYHSILSEIGRQAFNFVAGQGLAADIFKLALVYVQEELDNQGFDYETEGIILVFHDEILLEVKKENVDKAKIILDTCMKKAAYEIIYGVDIKVGMNSGPNWYLAKKGKP